MRRHRIRVTAPLRPALEGLRSSGLVAIELTDLDRGLLHIEGAAGYFTHEGDTTAIDVFEFDHSERVAKIVEALREAGLDVEHRAA